MWYSTQEIIHLECEEINRKLFEAKIILGADFYNLLSVMFGRWTLNESQF